MIRLPMAIADQAESPALDQHSAVRSLILHVAPATVAFATYLWIFLPTVVAWESRAAPPV